MEISSRVDILGPGDSFRNLEHRLRMIRSQQLDYAEHGMDAPPELERLAQRALRIGDEMTTGPAGRLVARARLAPHRGQRRDPRGVPGTRPPPDRALLPRAADRAAAPEEPGLAGARVHPRRADRQHRVRAPDAGQAAGRRAATGRVERRRPPRRPDRADRRHVAAARSSSTCTSRWRSGNAPVSRSSSPSRAAASRRCSARSAIWPRGAAYR